MLTKNYYAKRGELTAKDPFAAVVMTGKFTSELKYTNLRFLKFFSY